MRKACFASLALLLVPYFAFASVRINEIMYDPSGTDSGHEWLEVYNDGTAADISNWRLLEGGSKHKLVPVGSGTIPVGGYAVLADNPTDFAADYPTAGGAVFDTAFSGGLNNTNGESLALIDDTGATVDSVTYSPSAGGAGDGNSLQRLGGSWLAALPTPNAANATTASVPVVSGSGDVSTVTPAALPSTDNQSPSALSAIVLNIGKDRALVTGASTVFNAAVTDSKGTPYADAVVHWNLGDGSVGSGLSVAKTYRTAGTYLVSANAVTGAGSAHAEFTLTVSAPAARVTAVTEDGITIANDAGTRLDLSNFRLSVGEMSYAFPEGTIVLPKTSVTFSGDVTDLPFAGADAVLRYPDGTVLVSFGDSGTQLSAPAAGSYPVQAERSKSISSSGSSTLHEEVIAPAAATNLASVGAAIPSIAASSTERSSGFMAILTSPWTLGFLALIALSGAALLVL